MKLNYKRTIFVGMAFMAISAFWQVYDGLVPKILKATFDVNDAVSGVIMALDNVLAVVMLPLFGALSDRTKTRWGRRMPFIVCGTVAAAVLSLILPFANQTKNLALFVVGLGVVLFTMATFRSPAVALMPDVTPKPLRSKANAIINLTGTVGGILMLGAIALLVPEVENPNYWPVFILNSVIMLACLAVLMKTTNEPKLVKVMEEESKLLGVETEVVAEQTEEAPKAEAAMAPAVKKSLMLILASVFFWFMGYNAITTSFSKYAEVYWGMKGGAYAYTLIIAQAAAIISYIPAGIVATKIGRRKTIMGGVAALAIAFGSCLFFKSFSGMIFFFFILAGAGWAFINVNSYPMVVEMSKGPNVGKFTGYYYTASQAAQIITPVLSGVVLEYGYLLLDKANPDAGYAFLFPYGTIFVILSFVTMFFVRHGDAKVEGKKDVLESLDIDD